MALEGEALAATDEVVRAHLLRERAGEDGESAAYFFSHDKIREVVYAEAGDARRRVFHRRALEALQGSAPAAELAHHALTAGLQEPAASLSLQAGDEAMRLLATEDAIAHYDRAMAIARRLRRSDLLTELHARRGKARASAARWAEARRDLELALDGLGAEQAERRAGTLVDLLEVDWWLLDVPSVRRRATEVASLADKLERGDLEIAARTWAALAAGADGEVADCLTRCERVVRRAREIGIAPPWQVHAYSSISLYWLGHLEEAVQRSREAVEAARAGRDITGTLHSLPQLGLALAAEGRYGEAMQVFEEAREFGTEYRTDTLLARSVAMSAGVHLDLSDLAGAEALAREARERALALSFPPPSASAGIDLLLNFARRREVSRAEELLEEVAKGVEKASGFHGWLWRLRLAEARAEIALARSAWEEALRWADEAIGQSRARQRVKYQVLGLRTRAQALANDARTMRDQILAALPDGALRTAFQHGELGRGVGT